VLTETSMLLNMRAPKKY